jgi:hypothetical protein
MPKYKYQKAQFTRQKSSYEQENENAFWEDRSWSSDLTDGKRVADRIDMQIWLNNEIAHE